MMVSLINFFIFGLIVVVKILVVNWNFSVKVSQVLKCVFIKWSIDWFLKFVIVVGSDFINLIKI